MSLLQQAPRFDRAGAEALARELYGLDGDAESLPSERDQNFLVTAGGERYVLKIANATERQEMLEAQNAAMAHLEGTALVPRVLPDRGGRLIATAADGHFVRLLTWIPGEPLGSLKPRPPAVLEDLGSRLGQVSRALEGFDHPAARREFHWDLSSAVATITAYSPLIGDDTLRGLVERVAGYVFHRDGEALRQVRRSVVHGDANDYNVLVDNTPDGDLRVSGLIDFGDLLFSYTVAEPAVAIAYAVLDDDQPLEAAAALARGYHAAYPLTEQEISALFGLVLLRLCLSASVAGHQQRQRPDDQYLAISQGPIRRTLPRLASIPPDTAEDALRAACGLPPRHAQPELPKEITLAQRRQRIGRNVTIGYRDPVKVVRGWMQYLFDESGRQYLDAYNNVPHVGHAHPRITKAAVEQMRAVSTNTRYLHDRVWQFAERLTATLPDPLSVCYFVNSGSEANELALRLARAHTGAKDVVVLDAGYHGNTNTLIDISAYKFNGPGGRGAPDWVHVAPIPDDYRGAYKRGDPHAGRKYADRVGVILDGLRRRDRGAAAFICETCPSVGGQIIPPPGYLEGVYRHARAAGAVCIADEVQTGFGRMGSHFYAFESQNIVPDIVVLGKPIGNGYPLGAVVTSREIAESFADGMEFFSTFGGSTVSCAVGLAVLDVLEEETLQAHAQRTGARLLGGLQTLQSRHTMVGDVRGSGLFIGVELVRDRETLEPAAGEAGAVVEALREQGILIGTDGPWHNVLKIRPPMPFNTDDADRLVEAIDVALAGIPTG
jgi:4-aminobutyrate aminotransferase-like enzyme/Ser/Thr protein kinase RdoA (MazF antagonist)